MNKVWRFYYCSFLFFLTCTGTVYPQENQGSALKKVVIDPGHGGKDPGASGRTSKEKDIVLDISLRVGKMINEKYPDVEVIFTRKTDVYIEPLRRGDIANNANANLFISIHTNSMADTRRCASVFGAETFVMGSEKTTANMESVMRENSVIFFEEDHSTRYEGFDPNKAESYIMFSRMQNSYLVQSIDFAVEMQQQFKNSAKRVDRGVKQGPILVLWKTAMPSVLVEVGFICNPEEEKYMNSAAGKDNLASSIFRAFSAYKANIENRSSFLPANEINVVTETRTEESPKPPAAKKVEFCVQISTNSRPVETLPSNFKNHRDVERIQTAPLNYKYIVGRTSNYAAAQETLKKARADFADAFMVCIVDGKIIPLSEGLKLLNE